MENPIKVDDLGVPLFSETSKFWHKGRPGHFNSSIKAGRQAPANGIK